MPQRALTEEQLIAKYGILQQAPDYFDLCTCALSLAIALARDIIELHCVVSLEDEPRLRTLLFSHASCIRWATERTA